MKIRAISIIAASVAVVAMAQDGVKLRRVFTEGASDTYVCTFTGNNNMETPMGPMDIKMKGSNNMVIKYKAIKEEVCNVDVTTKDMKMEMEGLPEGAGAPDMNQMPKEVTMTGTLDTRNRMKMDSDQKGMDPMMKSMMASLTSTTTGFFVEFPDNNVKVGDSWEFSMPKMDPGQADSKVKATLVADKGETWEVKVAGKVPVKMNMGADQGMDMVMNMTMDSTYTILVEKSTGRAIDVKGKVDTDMKMEVMGMTIPGKGTMNYTAVLKK